MERAATRRAEARVVVEETTTPAGGCGCCWGVCEEAGGEERAESAESAGEAYEEMEEEAW